MATISYSFGDAHTPTHTYVGEPTVDVSGDGHADGIYLDFDGSGHADSIAWDSDGDGKVDTILVSTHHNGVYDVAYHDPAGDGHWNEANSIHPETVNGDQTVDSETGSVTTEHTVTIGAQPQLSYSFGDAHTPTHTYVGEPTVDVTGDGHADGIYLDFDGSGHADSIAWDSDGDGKVDTILVSSHHNGVYDVAYHDPAGDGHWNEADPIHGDAAAAGVSGGEQLDSGAEPSAPNSDDPPYAVGSAEDPYTHVATAGDEPGAHDLHVDVHLH